MIGQPCFAPLSTPHPFYFRTLSQSGVPWQRLLKVSAEPEGKFFQSPSVNQLDIRGPLQHPGGFASSIAMSSHSMDAGDSPGHPAPPRSLRRRVKHACDNCGSARTKCDGKLPWSVSPPVCSKNSRATARS
jgi:hypothetical protein